MKTRLFWLIGVIFCGALLSILLSGCDVLPARAGYVEKLSTNTQEATDILATATASIAKVTQNPVDQKNAWAAERLAQKQNDLKEESAAMPIPTTGGAVPWLDMILGTIGVLGAAGAAKYRSKAKESEVVIQQVVKGVDAVKEGLPEEHKELLKTKLAIHTDESTKAKIKKLRGRV